MASLKTQEMVASSEDDASNLMEILNRKVKVKIEIRSMAFDFEEWTIALSENRTLEDVTISVCLPSLGVSPVVHDFFRAIGRLPSLQHLFFKPGNVFWRLPQKLLLATFQQRPSRMEEFHMQDVEIGLFDSAAAAAEDFQLLADYVSAMPKLKKFAFAHCRLNRRYDYRSAIVEINAPVLNPLIGVLLRKPSLETMIFTASRFREMSICPLSDETETLQETLAINQNQPASLKELRLLKFEWPSSVQNAIFGAIQHHFPHLETLLLSACVWNSRQDILMLTQLLHHHRGLREVHLLGSRDLAFKRWVQLNREFHVDLANALQNSGIQRFFLEPHERSTIGRIESHEIPLESQKKIVESMETNYSLVDFRLSELLAPEWQACMEFYFRLNTAGRREVMMAEQQPGNNYTTSRVIHQGIDEKKVWVKVISTVNDNAGCIYYFLRRNPSLLWV